MTTYHVTKVVGPVIAASMPSGVEHSDLVDVLLDPDIGHCRFDAFGR